MIEMRRYRRHFTRDVEWLRAARLDAEIPLAALAKAVGRSDVWLAQREGGHRRLKLTDRKALERALKSLVTKKATRRADS
jgi:hypothetical protein